MRKSLSLLLLATLSISSSLVACSGDSKDDKDTECDPSSYGINNSGVQCAPDVADLMTQYYCTSDGKIATRRCDNGCNRNTGACIDASSTNCATGNVKWSCSEDGKTSIGCRNNKEAVDTCDYGCDTQTGRCKSAPCTENTYRCDNNALQKCDANGNWITEQNCGSDTCSEASKSCEGGNAKPNCTDGNFQCTDDKKYQKCSNGNWETIEQCDTSNDMIICDVFLDGCVDLSEEGDECYVHCDYDGLTLITCDKDGKEVLTDCTLGCNNAECVSDACSDDFVKTCRTATQTLDCVQGKAVAESCPDGSFCVDGECKTNNKIEACAWSGSICSDDKRYVQTCTDGTATGKLCDDGYTCGTDAGSSTAACIKAYTGDTISKSGTACDTKNFIPYCGSVSDSTYEVNTIECVNGTISTKGCANDRVCEVVYGDTISVQCRPQQPIEKLSLGDSCSNDDKFAKTAICLDGNIPAHCDSNTGKLVLASDTYAKGCAAQNMICSVTDVEGTEGVKEANCYDPCTVENTVLKTCGIYGGNTVFSADYVCTDLGDGQLGYVWADNSFKTCDISCSEGTCTDYTADIPNVGKSCDLLPNNNAYCLDENMLVQCASYTDDDDQTVQMIAGEKCYPYEKCTTVEDVAKCRQTCSKGDAPKTDCKTMLGNDYVATMNCIEVDGLYVYVDAPWTTWEACSSSYCQDGACK